MNTFIDFLEKLLIQLICFLDAFEKNDEKLIHSFSLEGIKVETDTGFKSVSHIHMTKKFVLYKILSFPKICSWPTTSSRVVGRSLDASGASFSFFCCPIYSNKSIFRLHCQDFPRIAKVR